MIIRMWYSRRKAPGQAMNSKPQNNWGDIRLVKIHPLLSVVGVERIKRATSSGSSI